MAQPIDALRDLGPRRTLFGAEALPRLPSSQKREPLRDRTNTTQKWSSDRKKRPPKPKNKPLKRPDTGAAPVSGLFMGLCFGFGGRFFLSELHF